jgi:hypothetical protein
MIIDLCFPDKVDYIYESLGDVNFSKEELNDYFKIKNLLRCNADVYVARQMIDKKFDRKTAVNFFKNHTFYKTDLVIQNKLDFIDKYSAYVVCYFFGKLLSQRWLYQMKKIHPNIKWWNLYVWLVLMIPYVSYDHSKITFH